MASVARTWKTPQDRDLALRTIANRAGLSVNVLPNACLFSIEHRHAKGTVLVNQIMGSPLDGGIGRLILRTGGARPLCIEVLGRNTNVVLGAGDDYFVWEGETESLHHRVTLSLQPDAPAWLWQIDIVNTTTLPLPMDAILIQDLGLGERGFLMNNEAYASQYIDHHIARHALYGPVVMSRQNLAQNGHHVFVLHGCLEGARAFATDGMQIFGPRFRAGNALDFPFGTPLPGLRLQHELACVAIQSNPAMLEPGASVTWRFFGLFDPDHSDASIDADLARIDKVAWRKGPIGTGTNVAKPVRSHVQNAAVAPARAMEAAELDRLYPQRSQEEHEEDRLLSFFVQDPPHNRHVVLLEKERLVTRRHGTILRSGASMLPDDAILCATCWMHGVFAAQLTIGNTSFHKLFSVSRDPYNITRGSGLRILIDTGSGWQLLAVPSAFEIGLSDCRWIYILEDRTIIVHAIASGEDAAMQWHISVEREACRFLVFGHLVLGERELDHAGLIALDPQAKRASFRPDPTWLWAQRYPDATYFLVTNTPDAIDSIGGDELLYTDNVARNGAYVALRTHPVREVGFAVVGSMTDAAAAERLAAKYEAATETPLASAKEFWTNITRGLRISGGGADGTAFDTLFPWLAHNAMIHLTVPHGLEQYTGAAWGTRDVCQGPVEFLLALDHDEAVKDILRIIFAQQYDERGDWPQWFMLEPYSIIQDKTSHGDVIVWPLKALNDYIETTNDLGFLDEPIAWRRQDNFERTQRKESVFAHVEKLLATIRERFIPGTALIRYGEGDWNDSLQPADPEMRDRMVSSWTVALLFQQLSRYAEILRRAGRDATAKILSDLADHMRADLNRFLIRDGTIAGYGVFSGDSEQPELLLHPSDTRTVLHYSLLPMTRGIIGGLFTPEQAAHHLRLIRENLLFPDGAHLIERPIAYHGGTQTIFKRAESAAFFGREIGLMYIHAHLRYAEAMAVLEEPEALLEALRLANPVTVASCLAQALPRQRNAYFSSSDAAFCDRYAASAEWGRVKAGTIGLDGGWRIYSSGPGLYTNMLLKHALGHQRRWGEKLKEPRLPAALQDMRIVFDTNN
jgi:cellobiose phosphorylase